MTDYYYEVNEIIEQIKRLNISDVLSLNLDKINEIIREKIKKITVIPIATYRIGHLAINTEDFLRYYAYHLEEYKARKELVLLYDGNPSNKISNSHLYEMIKRRIPVIGIPIYAIVKELAKKDPTLWNISSPVLFNQWIVNFNEFFRTPPQLWFTPEEEQKGEQLLEEMGIEPGKPFICFHNRDSAYLNYLDPENDWSYHDYRDHDIDNLIPAIEYLVEQGYYCIRMGQITNKPLLSNNTKIIDYASKFRTDFGDIYLSAKCRFFLGSGTGISHVSTIFNKPCIMTNMIPVYCSQGKSYFTTEFENILSVIYKKCWYIEEKRFLTFRELIDSQMNKWGHQTENYRKLGIEVIENSPEEILGIAVEMHKRFEGSWVETEEGMELQKRFYRLFSSQDGTNLFPFSRVGSTFLLQNNFLLD